MKFNMCKLLCHKIKRRKGHAETSEPAYCCCCRVAVLGAARVGKSCLIQRFNEQGFNEQYHPTVKDNYELNLSSDNFEMNLQVTDTPGREELHDIARQAIQNADAFILMFALDDHDTFETVIKLEKEICRIKALKPDVIPKVVVGNKMDLRYREVMTDEARRLFENQWDCPYVETSVKDHINLLSVLQRLRDELELSGMIATKIKNTEVLEN